MKCAETGGRSIRPGLGIVGGEFAKRRIAVFILCCANAEALRMEIGILSSDAQAGK